MTRDEAIATAMLYASNVRLYPTHINGVFNAKLRECGYWVAPMEPTQRMEKVLSDAWHRGGSVAWGLMRDAFLEEQKP